LIKFLKKTFRILFTFEPLFLNENKNFSLRQLSHIFRQETLLFSFRKSGFREVLSAR
jgi:hypothetical protein